MAEKEIKERFHKDLEIAKKFNDPIHQLMDKYYEQYRNRWSQKCDFRVSDLFAYVETVVPILTNNRVRGEVKAEFPEYVKHAEGMGYILDHTFDNNNWDYNAGRIAKMAEIYRYSLAYTGYDTEAKNGTGKLCVDEINPRWCYVDPAVTDVQEGSFFIYAEPMRMTKAIKLHPKKAKEIKESINRKEGLQHDDKSRSRNWFQSFFNSFKNFVSFNTTANTMTNYSDFEQMMELAEDDKRKESVAYIHHWYRDEDDQWRVTYYADDVFLEDVENPFWHGKLPYVPYVPCDDILSAVGIPVAEHIEQLNWEKNILMEGIIQSVRRSNDPPMLKNTAFGNTGDDQAMREKAQGTGIIHVNNPDMVPLNAIIDFVNLPQLPGGAFNLRDVLEAIEDKLLGTNDTMRGMGDATSGKEVQLKQEAAYTRIKTKIDNYEKFTKGISEMVIVNAMQFLDSEKPYRVKGDFKQYQDINQDETPFRVEGIQRGMSQDGQPEYDKKEFFLYANPNEWTKIEEPEEDEQGNPIYEMDDEGQSVFEEDGETQKQKVKEANRILQMVVEIEAGSSLPTSQSAKKEEAMELFGAGLIDQQAALEVIQYPNADEIIKRMSEAAQAQQQAEMQAKQMEGEQQMQMKQMEIQAKMQQQQLKNQGDIQEERVEQQPDLTSQLDQLRQIVPELAQASDEQIMQLLAGMGQQG
jgi:hypothetical protein